jgi:hypothetical protein
LTGCCSSSRPPSWPALGQLMAAAAVASIVICAYAVWDSIEFVAF